VKIHSILRHRRHRLELLIKIVLFAGTYSNAKMYDWSREAFFALFIHLHPNQRVRVYQMIRKMYQPGIDNYGKPRSDLTKETFFWSRMNGAWKLEKNTNCTWIWYRITSNAIVSISIHKCDIHSQKDSNLVDSASSIRLSQRLSHACLSINKSIRETANGSLYQL
jgi:hypothetical protein